MSLAVFAVVLAASFAPVLRYQRGRELAAPSETASRGPRSPATERGGEVTKRLARTSWGQPGLARDALLDEGQRALAAGDDRLAETLFARAAELEGDRAPAAAGLARVRLAQGDLEGAEGWVLVAIREQPRAAAYRALYADVLERGGRGQEAHLERALARSLAHFSGETRGR